MLALDVREYYFKSATHTLYLYDKHKQSERRQTGASD